MEPYKSSTIVDDMSVTHSNKRVKHRDGLGRVSQGPGSPSRNYGGDNSEHPYLRPDDGRLSYFQVQKTPKTNFPYAIRVLEWMFASNTAKRNQKNSESGQSGNTQTMLRWVPGSLAILFLMAIPSNYEGEVRNNGKYDPVRYREWLYAKSPRNAAEAPNYDDMSVDDNHESSTLLRDHPGDIELGHGTSSFTAYSAQRPKELVKNHDDSILLAREQGPKYLCFIDESSTSGYRCRKVKDWMYENNLATEPKFVFLSYTRKQFCVATHAELSKWKISNEQRQFLMEASGEDREELVRFGCQIAKTAGVSAFWLDFECLKPDSDVQMSANSLHISDVYRICDIVRVSSSMAIIRGPSLDARNAPSTPVNKGAWLQEWGTRLWTVPEALLCPSKVIDIYTRGEGINAERIEKRRLAASAWSDAGKMRDLIDHYESSIHLTPLELISIAFEGLQWRRTDQMTPGDTSYALMGLLRRRPVVETSDSDFEAFARLSLANDSDMLLERLLCMQPPTYSSPWSRMEDAWHAKLWDIQPECQVAGIVDNRTVTLDGAFAATIRWDSMQPVAFIKRNGMLRTLAKALVRSTPIYVLLGIIVLAIGAATSASMSSSSSSYYDYNTSYTNGIEIAGAVILALALLVAFVTPYLLYRIYRGKFWSTQAWFFGIEGIPDLEEVERCLFGMNGGRLKWSPFGSLLSRHRVRDGECVGLRPNGNLPGVDTTGLKVYTVIDTFTMTATAFHAARPPSTVMICGKEGGMQRAVLCSYDWETQTFCREAVLRMKTLVLERMSRIDRFRFCLDRSSRVKSTSQESL